MPTINLKELVTVAPVYQKPTIVGYNRLESRPRSTNFDRSLKAEVRDAMWMLTRQWQTGEFAGDNAGSAAKIKLFTEKTSLSKLGMQDYPLKDYDPDIPLETIVEREKIPVDLALRVQMGKYFKKLMKESLSAHFSTLLGEYKLSKTLSAEEVHKIEKDKESTGFYKLVKDRVPDGYKIYEEINDNSFLTWVTANIPGETAAFDILAENFLNWFKRLFSQPEDETDNAWIPSNLEYKFKTTARSGSRQEITLPADQYYSGNLDWYSFNFSEGLAPSIQDFKPDREVISFLPSPASIKGMPNARFWEMEENEINFGDISAGTTGLMNMLLAEFGLMFSNDWMIIPYKLPVNSLCKIKGIVVTDVFGDRYLIKAAGEGPDSEWERWAMYSMSNRYEFAPYNNYFFLPPTLTKSLESDPVEKVHFIRDEMANMAWGIESVIPSPMGKGISGKENVIANDGQHAEEDFSSSAEVRYLLGTKVPENWIPFIPVHKEGSVSEMHFQRAQMPRLDSLPTSGDGQFATIKPQGVILTEVKEKYFIEEEEIPKAGVIVKRTYQRTRWFDGKTCLWIGRRKETGRGQGSSRLTFDQIVDITVKKENDGM
ncbi:MAG TPA: hypothetical protein VE912_14975 [Bacteroidales bacterium]|nr:hypothetical protein [Bacteroidales bacterium]